MAKTSVPKHTKDLVLKRDNHACQIGLPNCTGQATGPDHRAGRGAGGSRVLNNPSNLIGACWTCNWQKEAVHGDARAELERRGVTVLMAGTNERTALKAMVTPFVDRNGDAWWLDDEGGKKPVEEAQLELSTK